MANISNINNILRTGSLGIGINRDPLSVLEVSSASKAGIKMFNTTGTTGLTYQLYSDPTGNFLIFNVSSNRNDLTINNSGNATFGGTVTTSDVYGASSLRIAALGGILYLDSGSGASTIMRTNGTTTALTLDDDQDAVFAGNLGIQVAPTVPLEIRVASDQHFTVSNALSTVALKAHNNGASAYIPMSINGSTLTINSDSNGAVTFGSGNATFGGTINSKNIFFSNASLPAANIPSINLRDGGSNEFYWQLGSANVLNIVDYDNRNTIMGVAQGGTVIVANAGGTKDIQKPVLNLKTNSTSNNAGLMFINNGATNSFNDIAGIGSFIESGNAKGNLEFWTRNTDGANTDVATRMIIKADGKVGIGTDSPNSYDGEADNLVIYDAVTPGITIALPQTTAAGSARGSVLFSDGTSGNEKYRGGLIYDHGTGMGGVADTMYIRTAVNNYMVLGPTGKVGIGTKTPTYKLDVVGNGRFSGFLEMVTGGAVYQGQKFYLDGGGDTFLESPSSNTMTFTIGATERMRIWSGGMIQIGSDATATPELLTVQAYTQNEAFSGKYSASGYLWFLRNETGPSGRFQLYNAGSTTINLEGNTSRDNYILGNVGIGVSAPNAQLDVGGTTTNQVGIALFTESSTTAYLTTSFNTRPTYTMYGVNTTNSYIGTRLSNAGNTEFFHGIVKGAANGEIKYVFQGYNGTAYQEFGYIDCYTTNAGSLIMSGDVVAYSDKKLKKNIKTLDGSKVYKMRGVSFDRIDTGKKSSGVIAQEMQEVAPELVNESGDTLGVAYGNISGYLIEAIKELEARIKILENK